MATTPDREPTLRDLSDKLDKLTADLEETQRFQKQAQQWQDRTWDVIKWVGGISAGLAISASIALVGIMIQPLGQ